MDAVGCIQSRACTSGTNLNLCSSCFPIEIHPYFFLPPLAEHPCRPLEPARLCCCMRLPRHRVHNPGHRAGAAIWPLGRAQLRGVGTQCCSVGGSAWSKKTPQKTPESSFCQTVLSHPIKSGTSRPISHYRCALAKRSERMDSFRMCSNTERCSQLLLQAQDRSHR